MYPPITIRFSDTTDVTPSPANHTEGAPTPPNVKPTSFDLLILEGNDIFPSPVTPLALDPPISELVCEIHLILVLAVEPSAFTSHVILLIRSFHSYLGVTLTPSSKLGCRSLWACHKSPFSLPSNIHPQLNLRPMNQWQSSHNDGTQRHLYPTEPTLDES